MLQHLEKNKYGGKTCPQGCEEARILGLLEGKETAAATVSHSRVEPVRTVGRASTLSVTPQSS